MKGSADRRDAVLAELAARAPHYVPEWRYHPSSPDAGAAMAFIWADMLTGTLERFDRLPDNYRRALLDTVGSAPAQALRSCGYLMFSLRGEALEPVIVPVGTRVAAPGQPQIALETDRELTASPAQLTAMYFVSPLYDYVRRYDSLENQPLFWQGEPSPHIWTLTHPYAFDISRDASLYLELDTRGGTIDDASWSFLDGETWRPLNVRRNDDGLILIFPEDKNSLYQQIRFTLLGGRGGEAELCAVRASPRGFSLYPDVLYAGDTQQPDTFYPFGQRYLPGLCFYAACHDALSKPGAVVDVSFDLRFEDFPIEGYPEPQVHWKKLMKASELAPPIRYEISVSELIWEYFNGIGWAALLVQDALAGNMFADGRMGRRTLRFICPEDVCATICGGHEALFIRARILKADNLFRMHGHYRTPVISKLRFGYQYNGGVPVTQAEVWEHMDSRTILLSSPVRPVGDLPSPCAMYFAFDKPFTQGTLMPVIASPGCGQALLRWEYRAAKGWVALDVHDGTGGMEKTGIIAYQTTVPCTKTRLFGQDAYWMRLADMENAYETRVCAGPRLSKLYTNVVTATAAEPGEASNLAEGCFTSMLTPVPGMAGALNPLPSYGGTWEEPESNVIRRVTASLSHGDRAVSSADYEALAMEASPRVWSARCYPDTDALGCRSRGSTCLVVMSGDGGETESLRRTIEAYVSPRRPLGAGRLYVTEPHPVAVNVELQAAIQSPDMALTVKKCVLEALAFYLNPLNGAMGSECPIGALPAPEAVNILLQAVPGVLWIYGLKVSYTCGMAVRSYEQAAAEPFAIPAGGEHQIHLVS